MSKVYGYCRTALVEGDNMEVQCAEVENYCKTRDIKLEKCFYDAGVSAHNMNRGGFNELCNVLSKGDIVVLKDISRLARNPQKCMVLVDKIYSIGAQIVYVYEPKKDDDSFSIEEWIRSKLS